jgi:hypothetical protein
MACVDTETGELIDPERLEGLQMERSQKIENVVLWIKNLLSDAEAIRVEKDILADRESKCRKKAEDLKKWLTEALCGQKFDSARCAVSFRRSESVEVADMELLPKDLLRFKTSAEPNRTAIKALLKNGQQVVGCRLVESQNVQIK